MGKLFSFFEHFLRDPQSVGAVTALSDFVVDSLVEPLRFNLNVKGRRILEAGAGMGNISRMIVEMMGPNDSFDIVELDKECCDYLKELFEGDERVHVYCGSILDWHHPEKYDFIISTLPFNSFPPPMIKDIFEYYRAVSTPSAWLTYVEYIGLHKASQCFSGSQKKQALEERRKTIREYLDKYLVHKDQVYLNFLPINVYHLNWQAETYTGKRKSHKKCLGAGC